MTSSKLIKSITKDNEPINTLTIAQHRALSLIVMQLVKLESKYVEGKKWRVSNKSKNFFQNALPIMLHTVALPELNLIGNFSKYVDVYDIDRKTRQYLRYIDHRYGTWYEPCNCKLVA